MHTVRVMHELALMESVVDTIVDRIGEEHVAIVRLEIGMLAGVAIEALRFCFEVCTRGTPLEHAALDIVALPGRARCRSCAEEAAVATLMTPCTCGSFDRELVSGGELRLKEIEVL
jgi:hydrogenase nickel incorporation protein HypA/HybF